MGKKADAGIPGIGLFYRLRTPFAPSALEQPAPRGMLKSRTST